MRGVRRILFTATVLVAVAVAVPAVTNAAPTVPRGSTFTLTFPAGEICSFPISLTVSSNAKVHDSGQGVIVATGPTVATVTNLESMESQTYNISGPELAGNIDVGPWLIFQPASRNVGPPFLTLTRGRVTFTPINTIDTVRGNVTDVCAALA
jgi:hypothetical protein